MFQTKAHVFGYLFNDFPIYCITYVGFGNEMTDVLGFFG